MTPDIALLSVILVIAVTLFVTEKLEALQTVVLSVMFGFLPICAVVAAFYIVTALAAQAMPTAAFLR